MTPPWFVRFLPQRNAAFVVARRFVRDANLPESDLLEMWDGRRTVKVTGAAPDGRLYGIGYEWTPEQVVRYVPKRRAQPRFDCPAAVWPADVLVPLRRVPVR